MASTGDISAGLNLFVGIEEWFWCTQNKLLRDILFWSHSHLILKYSGLPLWKSENIPVGDIYLFWGCGPLVLTVLTMPVFSSMPWPMPLEWRITKSLNDQPKSLQNHFCDSSAVLWRRWNQNLTLSLSHWVTRSLIGLSCTARNKVGNPDYTSTQNLRIAS